MITKAYLKDLTYQVNGAAIEVHKALGAGLLESAYHRCLAYELELRGIDFKTELKVPVYYKGIHIDTLLRCDLLVESILVLELKAIEKVLPIHEAQIITYMNCWKFQKESYSTSIQLTYMPKGKKTYVNDLYRNMPD